MPDIQTLYRAMLRIRRFEETVLDEFSHGRFYGTTHTYLGQEANAVGVLSHLGPDDIVVSNHRCHGHFLAYGGDMRSLFAELMGRATGVCGGRGGSQHLHWRNFYSNGILGGTLPLAAGMALAEKFKRSDSITIAFLGDGTLGEGVVYETLNICSLWSAPILFVVENNRLAQSTPIDRHLAGKIAARFSAFGIPVTELDTSDVITIAESSSLVTARVKSSHSPQTLILNTYRLGPHSKGDDSRPASEIALLRQQFDPVIIHAQRLEADSRSRIQAEVEVEVNQAFQTALADPYPTPWNNVGPGVIIAV
jgi:acetoin:2,6-dichlorophenolindophenol oxidoreductase subunit alpha